MLQQIRYKIEEINNVISNSKSRDYSLYGDVGGQLIFLYQYAKMTNDPKNIKKFEQELKKFVKIFLNADATSFASGIFGNIWLIEYFRKENIIDDLLVNIEDELNQLYLTTGEKYIADGNYDFLHGLLGLIYVGHYCEVIRKDSIEYLAKKMLESIKNEGDSAYFTHWGQLEENDLQVEKMNFGLSHGLPSAAYMFSKFKKSQLQYDMYTHKILKFMLNYKTFKEGKNRYSATIIKNREFGDSSMRLAWCYGDLGIACAFWNIGTELSYELYKQEAIDILMNCSKRRSLIDAGVLDAGICHGTAGIAHIFNRFYKETKFKEFDDARWFWVEETLKMSKFQDGYAGFKTFHGDRGWLNEYGLLEGISGIGLVLLGFLTEDKGTSNWDQSLLISN